MEAANRGAQRSRRPFGRLQHRAAVRAGAQRLRRPGIEFRYFFVRKTMFVKYARGFVHLPRRIRHARRAVRVADADPDRQDRALPGGPLRDRYWNGLLDWIRARPLAEGKVALEDLELFTLTDDVDEACAAILARYREREAKEAASQEATAQAVKKAAGSSSSTRGRMP